MKQVMIRGAGLLAVCLLAGCSILAPAPDQSKFFVLTALPSAAADDGSSAPAGVVYGLGPIRLPAYLQRGELATRVSPTEVAYSATDYWAEPLADNVSAVLLGNLITRLGTDRIVTYPWIAGTPVAYQVQITFLRFECDPSGDAQLVARWSITGGLKEGQVRTRETTITQAASERTSAAAAAALSAALGQLSDEIAAALRPLPAPEAPHGKAAG